jgi:hypothetical protein
VRSRCNLGALLGISLIVLGTSVMGTELEIILFVVVSSVGNVGVGLVVVRVPRWVVGSRVGPAGVEGVSSSDVPLRVVSSVGRGASRVVSSLAGPRVGLEVVGVDLSSGSVDTSIAVSGVKAGSSVVGVVSRVVGGDVSSGHVVISIAGSGVDDLFWHCSFF